MRQRVEGFSDRENVASGHVRCYDVIFSYAFFLDGPCSRYLRPKRVSRVCALERKERVAPLGSWEDGEHFGV